MLLQHLLTGVLVIAFVSDIVDAEFRISSIEKVQMEASPLSYSSYWSGNIPYWICYLMVMSPLEVRISNELLPSPISPVK